MKFYAAILAAALSVSSVVASPSPMRSLEEQATTKPTWVSNLTPIANTDQFHMKPVRALHVRVQSDAPAWDPTNKLFTPSGAPPWKKSSATHSTRSTRRRSKVRS